MNRRPDASALTCYYHAFEQSEDLAAGRFLYAARPTGGPFVLAASQNVYGDACAIFRRDAFLAVGGFETDRGTSFEDWEAFVKLVGRGHVVDVVPEPLFYYRHLPGGFSRTTDAHANHQRVLRQFQFATQLPAHEFALIGPALAGLERMRQQREASFPYRMAEKARMMWRWLRGGD